MFRKKSGSALSLWTLSLCWVSVFWTLGQGGPRVIGPSRPITASPGDDVILPCSVEPPQDVQNLTVEWSKPDLQADPSDRLRSVEFVHLYRNNEEDPERKISSYVWRTRLLREDLKRGNASLRILNVSLADAGAYRCFLPKLGSQVKAAVVWLVVDPHFVRTHTTELPSNLPTPEIVVCGSGHWSWLIAGMVGLLILLLGVSSLYVYKLQKSKGFQTVMMSVQQPEPEV